LIFLFITIVLVVLGYLEDDEDGGDATRRNQALKYWNTVDE